MPISRLSYNDMPSPEKGSPTWLEEKRRLESCSQMTHALYWYAKTVVWLIEQKYGLDAMTALKRFLCSEAYAMLLDDELEMMCDYSPDDLFEMWESEQITGDPRRALCIRGDS